MVRKLGLDTFVGRGSIGCWSACTLIWLSGRHAIIQRDSYLGFHAANVPEGTAMMVEFLAELGLTPAQINYMIRTPQPDIQLAMEMARQGTWLPLAGGAELVRWMAKL